jgi:8-oxo-dGTP pyrophosphatase MutT (NUDIX family)
MPQVEKVYAYIIQEERLLVFRHVDYPDAGVQVPGGTLEAGETPEAAVLREAGEETGLRGLVLEKCLGRDEYNDSSSNLTGTTGRYFFHLTCPHEVPETWQHYEHHPSDGSPGPILFEFYWLPLAEAAEKMDNYFSVMLDRMADNMSRE